MTNIIDIIRQRHSTRSYLDYTLNENETIIVKNAIKKLIPLKSDKILDWNLYPKKNHSGCIYSKINPNSTYDFIEYGFQGEQIVLNLTDLDYGTCWHGFTSEKNVPALIAFGKSKSDKKSLVMRIFGKRKALKSLITGKNNSSDNRIETILECCQIAPSAFNRQPWTFEIPSENEIIINSDKAGSNNLISLDFGIVISHCYFASKELYDDVKYEFLSDNKVKFTLK